jgi:hypothetical protein
LADLIVRHFLASSNLAGPTMTQPQPQSQQVDCRTLPIVHLTAWEVESLVYRATSKAIFVAGIALVLLSVMLLVLLGTCIRAMG